MSDSSRRESARKSLHPLFLPYYDALCDRIHDRWQPHFLGESIPQSYGLACRWGVFSPNGEIEPIAKEDPAWIDLISAVDLVGLQSGSGWGEPDYCEIKIAVSWADIQTTMTDMGREAAYHAIASMMIGDPISCTRRSICAP